jgi:hypothetical protein
MYGIFVMGEVLCGVERKWTIIYFSSIIVVPVGVFIVMGPRDGPTRRHKMLIKRRTRTRPTRLSRIVSISIGSFKPMRNVTFSMKWYCNQPIR